MAPEPLTPKQQNVLTFVQSYYTKFGYAPTIAEICEGVGLSSTSTVHKHLKTLAEKGHLDAMPGRSRGISVKPEPIQQAACIEVPLLGRVTAGLPIEMNEIPETIALPETMLGRGETFVLEVCGDSMIDEAIKDGDYVIVEKRDSARNGDMVIACIDNNEVTLKRIYREGDKVRLQPSNVTMQPIIIENRDVTIKGIVIGILRKYRRF